MKKIIIISITVLALILIAISIVFMTDMNRMRNNRPVVFSTWGYDYAPPEISPQTAINGILAKMDEKSMKTVTNLDNPKVEDFVFKSRPTVYCFGDKDELIGKPLYKITFNTTQDGLLGPMIFFVDKSNGELVGMEYRE